MPKTIKISSEEVEAIKAQRREIRDKKVDKRLYAIQLRGEGHKNSEIAEKLDTSSKVVSRWVAAFSNGGIEALLPGKFGGNHRNATPEEELAFMEQFRTAAEKGQIISVSEIAEAYDKRFGKSHASYSTVYYLLHKLGWRKIMPRSKHPNKASDEAIEASKKLTGITKN
jgi:transposase